MPSYDAFTYDLKKNEMTSDFMNLISAPQITHEGLHFLISERFGYSKPGLPLTTLFNECSGLGMDIYWTASICSVFPHRIRDMTEGYRKSSIQTNIPFKAQFKRAMKNPFQLYQETVLESLSVFLVLLEELEHSLENRRIRTKTILGKVKKMKHINFINGYNFSTPILFIASHYGLRSTRQDRENLKKFLEILNCSTSMANFFEKLGVIELTRKFERCKS